MILTREQTAAFQKSLASVATIKPQLEYFETVAQSLPHIAEQVADLRTRFEYVKTMCEVCLAVDREMSS